MSSKSLNFFLHVPCNIDGSGHNPRFPWHCPTDIHAKYYCQLRIHHIKWYYYITYSSKFLSISMLLCVRASCRSYIIYKKKSSMSTCNDSNNGSYK